MGLNSSPNSLRLCSTQTAQPDVLVLPDKPAYFRGHLEYRLVVTHKVPAEFGFSWCPA